ncbi:MAG: tyrosine--tRNA ligase [Thermoplasmata archaeon]
MDVEARFHRIAREAQEILVPDELKTLLGREEHPRAYIGFEPSGQLTLGSLITARKMRDLTDAGCDLTVLLADWHAWINDKMGGSLERIQAVGTYMEEAFHALGVDPGRTRFRWAHDVVERSAYWARVVRIAKAMSLQRAKRAMTIMGRGEDETQLDTAKLLYPAMQAADIFELPVDIAYSGMDQRRVHVLARELAQHFGWPVPVAIHTPLLPSLKGRGRMDPADPTGEGKMSKSDPTGAVLVPMEPEPVRSAIQAALCPAKQTDGNPVVDTVRYILFPWEGRLTVERTVQHGGHVEFTTFDEFLNAWTSGDLHPADLKPAVAEGINRIMAPVRQYFGDHPETIHAAFGATTTKPR